MTPVRDVDRVRYDAAHETPPPARRPASQAPEPSELPGEWESYVGRFAYPARREVRRLMRSSPRLVDLAVVFPGAIYALAARRSAPDARREAIALIEKGAPLKSVARLLEPAAVAAPPAARSLPESDRGRSAGERELSRAASPTGCRARPRTARFWLQSVAFGAKACHEDFALWLADQSIFSEPGNPEQLFGVLAAYAWHSRATQTRAHNLIVVPWRPEIAFDTALCAAKSWLNRMRLVLQLGPGVITDSVARRAATGPRLHVRAAARPQRDPGGSARHAELRRPVRRAARPTTAAACSPSAASASTWRRWRSARTRARPACWRSRSSRGATTWPRRSTCGRRLMHGWPRRAGCGACRRAFRPSASLDNDAWTPAHGALPAPHRRRAVAAGDRQPGGVRRLQRARWRTSPAAAASRPGCSPKSIASK